MENFRNGLGKSLDGVSSLDERRPSFLGASGLPGTGLFSRQKFINIKDSEKLGWLQGRYSAICEAFMDKKRKSPRELLEALKAIRKRPIPPKEIEEFNRIVERDDACEQEDKKRKDRKIARPPEADI